jgi:hypothetical protein
MKYSQLDVPSDSEVLDALGVESLAEDDEETTRVIRVPVGDEDILKFSYDTVGRSVRVRWERASETILDVFREGIVRISVESEHGEAKILAFSEFNSLRGEIIVQIFPRVMVQWP